MKIINLNVLQNPKIIEEIGRQSFNQFYSSDKIIERLVGKYYWCNLARDNNKNVGFQISYSLNETETYFWLLGVIPQARKKGIASRLIDFQEDVSKKYDHNLIILRTHLGHPNAIRLYKQKGFEYSHEQKDCWGKDKNALYFKKRI